MNPIGPEQPSTYWRRRAAVIAGLVVVLWLIWLLLRTAFGLGGDPVATAPESSPSFGLSMSASPDASEDPAATAQPDPSASAAPSGSPTPSPSPSPSATAACTDADITVLASTAGSSTSVGSGMALTMSVTNTGKAPCTRDVGAGANEMRITSGSALVWSSDFCNASKAEDVADLAPDKPFMTSVTWPGRVTVQSCPADQPLAQPGSYKVIAINGGVESAPVTFTVK